MKRLVFFVFILFVLFMMIPQGEKKQLAHQKDAFQVIPEEAIRLRILANSDGKSDQKLKYLIRDRLNEEITKWVEHLTSIDEAREMIRERLPEVKEIVHNVLEEENSTYEANVQYEEDISFPLKMYDSLIYPPGEYEAILVTLGKGRGSNWWCVLFPPLCFLDFSNNSLIAENDLAADDVQEKSPENENETKEKPVKIKFFLFEWLGWS